MKVFNIIFISLITVVLYGQTSPFNLKLEAVSITGLCGIQSYSYAQDKGKWLIIGGRLDGLHRRQPWATFDLAGHNNQLIVIDPVSLTKWTSPLSSLPVSIREQLSSTNMEFYQEGDYLYCFGGYGYSTTAADHTTFANLTAIHVPSVIAAIMNQKSLTPHFRQISDANFQVTGGKIKKINDKFYLLGGQKFIGRYNPMGPTHGPGFIQEYTNAVRIFTLEDDGVNLKVTHFPAFVDALQFHRRDYNAEAQILPNGQEGITLFSGVFRTDADLPYLNAVTMDNSGYKADNNFSQYYNHYHCAVLPLYSAAKNEMHTVFFGGIAQYYDNAGTLVQDNNVPFVKTIARVTRNANGSLAEYKLPIEMPSLLGAGSEFIVNPTLPQYRNGVLKLDELTENTTLGYLFGGIESSAPNIFFINEGTESVASNRLYKVVLTKTTSNHELNTQSIGTLKVQAFPNPNDGNFDVYFNIDKSDSVKITLLNSNGQLIHQKVLKEVKTGENSYRIESKINQGIYFLHVETASEKAVQKIVID